MEPTLMQDARHMLNRRSRGLAARTARLEAAGVTTERAALSAWLRHAEDTLHEAAGGVYHACTVRLQNGADSDLPTAGPFGCRISRVPVRVVQFVPAEPGEGPMDEGSAAYWVVNFGSVGCGFMTPAYVPADDAATEQDAESLVRNRLLEDRGESCRCFQTRAEAQEYLVGALAARATASRAHH